MTFQRFHFKGSNQRSKDTEKIPGKQDQKKKKGMLEKSVQSSQDSHKEQYGHTRRGEGHAVCQERKQQKFKETLQSYLQIAKVKYVKIRRFTLCPGVQKFFISSRKYSYFAGPCNWKSRGRREYSPHPQIYVMVHKHAVQQNTTEKCRARASQVGCRLRINNL